MHTDKEALHVLHNEMACWNDFSHNLCPSSKFVTKKSCNYAIYMRRAKWTRVDYITPWWITSVDMHFSLLPFSKVLHNNCICITYTEGTFVCVHVYWVILVLIYTIAICTSDSLKTFPLISYLSSLVYQLGLHKNKPTSWPVDQWSVQLGNTFGVLLWLCCSKGLFGVSLKGLTTLGEKAYTSSSLSHLELIIYQSIDWYSIALHPHVFARRPQLEVAVCTTMLARRRGAPIFPQHISICNYAMYALWGCVVSKSPG